MKSLEKNTNSFNEKLAKQVPPQLVYLQMQVSLGKEPTHKLVLVIKNYISKGDNSKYWNYKTLRNQLIQESNYLLDSSFSSLKKD